MLNRKSVVLMILLVLMVCPATVMALTGGPDAGGYSFYDSNEKGAGDFSWVNISKSGTPIEKEVWLHGTMPVPVDIGFNFEFYGKVYSRVYVSEYGYITFEDHQLGYFKLETIPEKALYGSTENFIAGVWANLFPGT